MIVFDSDIFSESGMNIWLGSIIARLGLFSVRASVKHAYFAFVFELGHDRSHGNLRPRCMST